MLERELGRGGMATVWLARDLKHDRPVALKLLAPLVSATLGAERFLREIRLAARLQHPHIVPVFDSGEAESPHGPGQLWFTMPYVEGESLRDRLRRNGAIPPAEALRIARQVAQALAYAHEHEVVHRDIKPENILLTQDGNTLVADFGIARVLGQDTGPNLTATGMIIGTPAYMSPEQAGGGEVDRRTDVYSLGCVLYEMLTGRPPFGGSSAQALVAKHLTEAVPAIDPRTTGVPASVSRAVARALAKSPAERFPDAAGFATALEPEAAATAPATPVARRRLGLAAGLVAAVAVAAFLALGSPEEAAPGSGPAEGAVASGFHRRLSQLTFGAGVEEWPAWSPDGTRLAYVGEADGFRQLFVRDLATGAERQLTRDPRDHIQPAWSPDGRRLAYAKARAERGKLKPSDLDGWYYEDGDLWSLDVESGEETPLVEDAFGPAYSPDGTSLAFDAEWAGPRRIWISDIRGHNPRQITSDSSDAVVHTEPTWSPDGARLAFRRVEKTVSDIAVADLATQTVLRVTDDPVFDTDPAWSPSGTQIYFSSLRGGGLNLWRVPVDRAGRPAGAAEQLTTGAGNDVQVVVAPAGDRLAFAVRGISSDLWRAPLAPATGRPTGAAEPVLATTRVESRAAWSPDGRWIAFNSDRAGEMNLWIRSTAGGDERRLTEGSGGDYQPDWSPDGGRLAFFSARGGNTDIWTVAVESGELRRLTDDPALDINPFWSPDGSRIAFVSDRTGRSEIWIMAADGGGQRRLTSVGVGGHSLRWTADGRSIVFRTGDSPPARIFRVSAEDGTLTRLPEVGSGAHMSFSPSQELILDVRNHQVLWIYPVDGRPAYEVFRFDDPDVRIDYPVWSPDGRWVMFDRAAPPGGDLWVLEGLK